MKRAYDYRKLRGKIREVFGTQSVFARELGLSEVSLSAKLNNAVEWTQEEIETSVYILDIPWKELPEYFFTPKVEKISTNRQKGNRTLQMA